MKNIEQELKMSLTEREYAMLCEFAQKEPTLQTNWYFGNRDMPQDMMVRVRQKGEFLLCYKRRLADRDGITVCDEREYPLSYEHAGYILQRGVTADEMRKLLNVHVDGTLLPLGKLETYRTKFALNEWNLELDKNLYLGQTDFELECEHNDVSELNKLKNYLYYKFGVPFRPSKPKSERFWEALNK